MTGSTHSNNTNGAATDASDKVSMPASSWMALTKQPIPVTLCSLAGVTLMTRVSGFVSGSIQKPVFTLSPDSLAALLAALGSSLQQQSLSPLSLEEVCRYLRTQPQATIMEAIASDDFRRMRISWSQETSSASGSKKKATSRKRSTAKGARGTQ